MASYLQLKKILDRRGCQFIELPISDEKPFIAYLTKSKFKHAYEVIKNKSKIKIKLS